MTILDPELKTWKHVFCLKKGVYRDPQVISNLAWIYFKFLSSKWLHFFRATPIANACCVKKIVVKFQTSGLQNLDTARFSMCSSCIPSRGPFSLESAIGAFWDLLLEHFAKRTRLEFLLVKKRDSHILQWLRFTLSSWTCIHASQGARPCCQQGGRSDLGGTPSIPPHPLQHCLCGRQQDQQEEGKGDWIPQGPAQEAQSQALQEGRHNLKEFSRQSRPCPKEPHEKQKLRRN